ELREALLDKVCKERGVPESTIDAFKKQLKEQKGMSAIEIQQVLLMTYLDKGPVPKNYSGTLDCLKSVPENYVEGLKVAANVKNVPSDSIRQNLFALGKAYFGKAATSRVEHRSEP